MLVLVIFAITCSFGSCTIFARNCPFLPKLRPFSRITCHGSVMTWFAPSNITLVGDPGPTGGFSFVSHTIHSFELTYLAPSSTALPLYTTTTQCLRKVTPHPASVRCTTDASDCDDANPGMMCPVFLFIGSCWRLSLHTCVDLSIVPSGMVTVIGLSAGVTLLDVALTTRKWLVAPESSTAHLLIFSLLASKILRIFWGVYELMVLECLPGTC